MMSQTANGELSPNSSEVGLISKVEEQVSFGDGRVVDRRKRCCSLTAFEIANVAILCFVNLINYMDRFTVAGILTDIQCFYKIGDDKGGLLQTGFVLSYMIFAPLFGYLGDRYSRKLIMALGVFLWSLTTLLGSFMDSYGGFLAFRMCVGIGEASYSTIAPTIISDLFVKDVRSRILAVFYFAIPVGSGLGYIIGSEMAKLGGSWHWGLRVTPVLGLIAVILILTVLKDPPRGESEGGSHLTATSWTLDLKYLCKNKSFMFSTLGFTCVAFVAGALSWWGPKFITLGMAAQGDSEASMDQVAYMFGVITMISGLVGVPLGAFLGQKLRVRWGQADGLVCSAGMFLSAPLLLAGIFLANVNSAACYALVFFGEVALNLNWAVVADILLYVVIPTRRSTAEAFQILLSHMFGDAGSPYLIGIVSETLKGTLNYDNSTMDYSSISSMGFNETEGCQTSSLNTDHPVRDFHALKYAIFICIVVEVLGGIFFLLSARYIVHDKNKADSIIAGANGLGSLGDVEVSVESRRPHHIYAHEPEARTLMS